MPDEHVLDGGHVLEQADVLERPTDAGFDHVVGPGAAEDPDADELLLVPDGPDDREQQRRDQQREDEEADQGQEPPAEDPGGRNARRQRCPSSRAGSSQTSRLVGEALGAGDHPPPPELDGTVGGVDDAEQDVEERRLAGAVRSDQADDRPFGDREVDLVDGDEAAEPTA